MLERIGPISYRLAFPTSTRAHNVFHVSFLKKYVHDPNHVTNFDSSITRGIVPNQSIVHPRQEGHSALELSRWTSKGVVEALRS